MKQTRWLLLLIGPTLRWPLHLVVVDLYAHFAARGGHQVILTVADLIDKLRQMPQDAMVLVRDGVVVDVMEIAGHVQMLTAATDDDADDDLEQRA
jgi:hypothetical protein